MKNEKLVTLYIKSAVTKKVKDYRVCNISYKKVTERKSGRISITNAVEDGTDPVHKDLTESLKALLPHFLLASERANINEFQPSYFKDELYKTTKYDYEVTGVHIKEYKDRQYAKIVGRQILRNKQVISMNPPMICFEFAEGDEDVYPFHAELKKAILGYLDEVGEYQDGEKIGTPDQSELDLKPKSIEEEEEVPETEMQVNEDTSEVAEVPVTDQLDQVIKDKKKPAPRKKATK